MVLRYHKISDYQQNWWSQKPHFVYFFEMDQQSRKIDIASYQ